MVAERPFVRDLMGGKLDDIVVTQQTSRSLIIGWLFIPFGVADPAAARVRVYRSDVQSSGFTLVAELPAERGWYEDTDVNTLDRWSKLFYKIELIVDNTVTSYSPVGLNEAVDSIARALRQHTATYLRHAGIPVLVYQTIRGGDRCPVCWDAVLRKVARANCESCYGTGYVTGYHAPVLTLAAMGVEGKQNTISDRIEQDAMLEMLLSHYPLLRPNDIIFEVDAGRRYRVQQVAPIEKHRMLINQSVTGFALSTSNTEHDIPIPDISTMTALLSRVAAPHRLVSSTDGERFDYSPFSTIQY